MKTKRTEVLLSTSEKKQLREFFNVSHGTLNAALKGITQSYLARQIRKRGILIGGVTREREI